MIRATSGLGSVAEDNGHFLSLSRWGRGNHTCSFEVGFHPVRILEASQSVPGCLLGCLHGNHRPLPACRRADVGFPGSRSPSSRSALETNPGTCWRHQGVKQSVRCEDHGSSSRTPRKQSRTKSDMRRRNNFLQNNRHKAAAVGDAPSTCRVSTFPWRQARARWLGSGRMLMSKAGWLTGPSLPGGVRGCHADWLGWWFSDWFQRLFRLFLRRPVSSSPSSWLWGGGVTA